MLNSSIRFSKLFLIGSDGEKIGVVSRDKALGMAEEANMDLVLISNDPKKPVAKILDYGKFKYNRSKKAKETKSKQTIVNNREIRLSLMIGIHDLKVKAKKAREFLERGDRVKVSLKFRGREITRQELGRDKLEEFFALVSDVSSKQKEPESKANGRFLDLYLLPSKSKKQTMILKEE